MSKNFFLTKLRSTRWIFYCIQNWGLYHLLFSCSSFAGLSKNFQSLIGSDAAGASCRLTGRFLSEYHWIMSKSMEFTGPGRSTLSTAWSSKVVYYSKIVWILAYCSECIDLPWTNKSHLTLVRKEKHWFFVLQQFEKISEKLDSRLTSGIIKLIVFYSSIESNYEIW